MQYLLAHKEHDLLVRPQAVFLVHPGAGPGRIAGGGILRPVFKDADVPVVPVLPQGLGRAVAHRPDTVRLLKKLDDKADSLARDEFAAGILQEVVIKLGVKCGDERNSIFPGLPESLLAGAKGRMRMHQAGTQLAPLLEISKIQDGQAGAVWLMVGERNPLEAVHLKGVHLLKTWDLRRDHIRLAVVLVEPFSVIAHAGCHSIHHRNIGIRIFPNYISHTLYAPFFSYLIYYYYTNSGYSRKHKGACLHTFLKHAPLCFIQPGAPPGPCR